MALAYSNTLTGNPQSSLTQLNTGSGLSGLSSTALANAKARGLGSGLSVIPSGTNAGQVSSNTAPTGTFKAPTTASASSGSGVVNPASVASYKGVPITSGDDKSVSDQIAKIDAQANQQSQLQQAPTQPLASLTIGGAATGSGSGSTSSTQTNKNGAPTYSGLVGQLANLPTSAAVTQGQTGLSDAIKRQQQLESDIAGKYGAIEGQAIPLNFQQGREQALARQYASQEAAAQNAVTQNQTALNQAITLRGQDVGALTSAASYAQPQTAAYGQTTFNPLTGQYEGNSGLPADVLDQYAQMAANGQYASIPSAITSNPVLSAQLNAAATKINPNYNPIASQAQGSAQASNIQTAGTAGTNIAASGLASATQNYVSANTSFQQAENQSKNLLGTLSGINGINSKYANTQINALKNQFGSTQYTGFITALAEARQAYTQLLASVGASTPTVNGQQADAILDASSTPAQIQEAINKLNDAAYAKLLPLYQQIQTYQGNLGGGSQQAPSQGGTGSGSGLYSF